MADETLNIIINKTSKGDGAKKTASGLDEIKKAVGVAVGAFAALKSAQVAIDFVEFGAGVERQEAALDGLARSAGTSGDAITSAIRGASDFTIDRMTAMSAASKAMVLDVAETPEQFERLTRVATSLGRAMGQDAAKSIDDFVVAAGRQSMQIADNLGLVVRAEQAQERYAAQIGKTAAELTDAEKKQAFLNEMLVQGEAKMREMGGASLDSAGKIEASKSAVKDMGTSIGALASSMAESTGTLDRWRTGLSFWSGLVGGLAAKMRGVTDETTISAGAVSDYTDGWARLSEEQTYYSEVADDSRSNVIAYRQAIEEATIATQNQTLAQMDLSARLADASQAQIAQAAITQLKQALDAGTITFDQYEAAVMETQLAFGLATPQSNALSGGIGTLSEALANGELNANDYAEALGTLIGESERAVIVSNRVRDALNGIPRNINVSINVQERIAGREGGLTTPGQQRQSGGYVMSRKAVLVGEEGPELAVFPPGTEIYNALDTTQMIRNAATPPMWGGDFRSSRGSISLPGPRRPAPDMYGGGLGFGGGTVVHQTWHQVFYVSGYDRDPRELAREIKLAERMEGDRPEMGRLY